MRHITGLIKQQKYTTKKTDNTAARLSGKEWETMKQWLRILLLAVSVTACLGNAKNVESAVAEEDRSLAISRENFPDKNVRKVLSKDLDKNKDQILSREELAAAKELALLYFKKIESINLKGISKLKHVKTVWVEAYDIKNLTEFKKMPQLTKLDVETSYNESIDLSQNINLQDLRLDMHLDKLDLKYNKKLQRLWLYNACFKNLTVENLPELERLYLPHGRYKCVAVKNCPKLVKATMDSEKLKKLIMKKLPSLEVLKIANAKKIKSFKIPSFPNLKEFKIGTNGSLKALKIPSLPKLEVLTIGKNQIKKINFKKVPNLKELIVNKAKKITKIDIGPLKKLKELSWQNGKLKKIRFGKKKKLRYMYLNHNRLGGTWKLSRFPKLYEFSGNYNRIEYLYGRSHKNLVSLECEHNKLKKLDLYNIAPNVIWFKGNPHVEAYLLYKGGHAAYYRFDKTAKVHYKEK